MSPTTRPEPFHRDLRLARWLPPIGASPRTLKIMRGAPRARKSTSEVRAHTRPLAGATGALPARVFRPTGVSGPTPLFLWIHGGGLVVGTPQQDDGSNLALARDLGVTVVAPSYRLAPEHPGPAALDDLTAAYRDLVARADEFGIDPRRIAIGGASAGGGLAAALAHRLHDEGGPQPLFQLLVYPMLDDRTVLREDIDTRHARVWLPRNNRFGWTSYLGAEPGSAGIPPALAPARREDLSGLPPAWIGVGTLDLFHDEDLAYAKRLRDAGVPCDVHVIPGAFHGFDALFRGAGVTAQFHGEWTAALRRAFAQK